MRPRRMPWKETGPFEERRRFVETCRDSDESFGAICEQFGISRQKGYKWLDRFEEGGLEGLVDRSRRWGHASCWPSSSATTLESSSLWRAQSEASFVRRDWLPNAGGAHQASVGRRSRFRACSRADSLEAKNA